MYCVTDILYIAIILVARPTIRFTLVALSEMSIINNFLGLPGNLVQNFMYDSG